MRYLTDSIAQLCKDKFLLLSGPRQVGKTSLAKEWLLNHAGEYLTWDFPRHRKLILALLENDFTRSQLIVLDEFHKYPRWKSFLKGLFDTQGQYLKVIVTGSARLDIYQKGGDSLLGRYEHLRLHPFSIGELTHGSIIKPPHSWIDVENVHAASDLWPRLEKHSGFPEPYSKNSASFTTRWSERRRSLLIREDLRDLSQVRSLSLIEQLTTLLPERVGSPLSLNSLREDLQVAHDTVKNWLEILDRLYYCFSIPPYHRKLNRSIRKERKYYLWNWAEINDPGARFENMVACHLLKSIHAWNDLGLGIFSLCYWRNQEKEEVDFVICDRNKPVALIECKTSPAKWHPALSKLSKLLGGVDEILLIAAEIETKTRERQKIISAAKFLAGLV